MTSKWSNISIKDMGVAVERVWRRIRSLKTRIQFIKGSSDDIVPTPIGCSKSYRLHSVCTTTLLFVFITNFHGDKENSCLIRYNYII